MKLEQTRRKIKVALYINQYIETVILKPLNLWCRAIKMIWSHSRSWDDFQCHNSLRQFVMRILIFYGVVRCIVLFYGNALVFHASGCVWIVDEPKQVPQNMESVSSNRQRPFLLSPNQRRPCVVSVFMPLLNSSIVCGSSSMIVWPHSISMRV